MITGGAGFIGSAVIRHLINDSEHEVVNVDVLTYAGNLQSVNTVSESGRYSFECVDVCDAGEIKRIFELHRPDIVMHLAAESHVDRSIKDPGKFIQTNIIGTSVLLDQARAYYSRLNANQKNLFRFHHVSSDEVYGDLPHPDSSKLEKTLPYFTESSSYNPSSPYAASKASSDHLVRAWHRTYGLPVVISNCSNNYGPYQFPEKLIPLVILNALQGKPLPVYGKGNQIRDWLYVEDHARALVLVATKGVIGEAYNIGGHNEKRNIEVVYAVCDELDRILPIGNNTYRDLITLIADRPGHDKRYAIDASKIKNELFWNPLMPFEAGLKSTIKWYLENEKWCRSVKADIF